MKFKDLEEIMHSDDLFDKMFVNGQFSYNEPIMIDQISLYDDSDSIEAKDDAEKFGCKIYNDDDVLIPTGLPFTIHKTNVPYAVMEISRNGVTYYPEYVDDNEIINVEFTEFGQKLYSYSKSIYTTIPDAYNKLQQVETIFGVKIID